MIGEAALMDALEGVHSGRLRVREAYRAIRATERALPSDRHQIEVAVGRVLFNVSNWPEGAQRDVLGYDVGAFRALIVNAVMELTDDA